MGIKRPFEEENFPEASFKQCKHPDDNVDSIVNTEESRLISWGIGFTGEAPRNIVKLQFDGQLEVADSDSTSLADKELEASAPLSLITSSSGEEDSGDGNSSFLNHLPEYIDSSIPRRSPRHEDPYIYLLNCSPRKEVPIGLDHQVAVQAWDPDAGGKCFSGSNHIAEHDRERKLMGISIIPMPRVNDSTIDGVKVGRGRADCNCLDGVSMRCVQQHVKEAKEKLREDIGHESFARLGFYDMGDEVVCKWTPDDEQVFHEIVFSNPVSQGRKFWKHLRQAFATRTKQELVSYYFNVFVLHQRAVQNRSYFLDIDSDDDEEPKVSGRDGRQNASYLSEEDSNNDDEEPKGGEGDFHSGSYSLGANADFDDSLQCPAGEYYLFGGEEEDGSTVESLDDQDLDASWLDDFWSEPENAVGDSEARN